MQGRVLVMALALVVAGCAAPVRADSDRVQKCQGAKDVMATGLPVDEFKPDPVPPLPADSVQEPRGKQTGETVEVAAVIDADPEVVKRDIAKVVTARGWAEGDQEPGAMVTYRSPTGLTGDVRLVLCDDEDDFVVFRQQGK
ncbi:hypothetical protein [Kibdelosporangium phytohabitans]|uniref:Lipoprotein n=1 Tax=Kibdelosporangium phytohabitans TaxID=860235 RepID=A0A0N7F574_9PSEU|nr:hypothetical protein [Kibdelosporangium phytohabitans]ALG13439.1 hypothetical protein AOZ06_47165 [Kibdelosporangium phytohabitans]MBE1465281.1 hypothetical protein [Kibdelosporangium phytohabitans]